MNSECLDVACLGAYLRQRHEIDSWLLERRSELAAAIAVHDEALAATKLLCEACIAALLLEAEECTSSAGVQRCDTWEVFAATETVPPPLLRPGPPERLLGFIRGTPARARRRASEQANARVDESDAMADYRAAADGRRRRLLEEFAPVLSRSDHSAELVPDGVHTCACAVAARLKGLPEVPPAGRAVELLKEAMLSPPAARAQLEWLRSLLEGEVPHSAAVCLQELSDGLVADLRALCGGVVLASVHFLHAAERAAAGEAPPSNASHICEGVSQAARQLRGRLRQGGTLLLVGDFNGPVGGPTQLSLFGGGERAAADGAVALSLRRRAVRRMTRWQLVRWHPAVRRLKPAETEARALVLSDFATLAPASAAPFGPPPPPPAGSPCPAVLLVLARFREDVSWLARLPPGVEYHVMQKGGAVQRELPACRQTALPNVGREAHAYLSCEAHSYLSFLETVHAASASAAEAARLLPPLLSLLAAHVSAGRRPPRWVPLGLWSGGERIVYCDASGAPHQALTVNQLAPSPLLLPIGRVWRALFGEGRALPTWIGFTPGACFAVCREALLRGLTPSRVEAALSPSCGLGGLEADTLIDLLGCHADPLSGHVFERLWRYLCGYGEEEEELGEHAANWVNTAHGWGSAARGTTAALAMVRCDADFVSRVALLDVNAEELPGFYEREAGYSIADTLWAPGGAMERHCAGSEYVAAWMRSSLRPLWPPAGAHLLPAPGYLRLCAAAHRRAGLLDHFLDSTLLHDGVTTLRAHCERDEGARRAIASLDEEEAAGSDEEAASMHGDARGALSRSSGHGVTLEP
ncbi:hypothetical protein EMIHUDRAFT_206076 [Emiliania huxleyi CCMP1516]|uniref:Uncharacterized protein n=2 Tax=Emiliania huxleyi TaxID=2903 RepID=A0A0D3JQT7_EMIH1|nr:hypothetical protein EMIHUDRAFT_206076 [Emiliania huxleyi CCMP1516]EOD25872.1 hypothetical protein EMIHUDRAFT_206076 [Emiliania huxleyi CCMP1516]|eukprot:XP_005778301.1 hypothetical protein EMIHUDRAFT_206076 [Emiliania huxleyi CCMP1516]